MIGYLLLMLLGLKLNMGVEFTVVCALGMVVKTIKFMLTMKEIDW